MDHKALHGSHVVADGGKDPRTETTLSSSANSRVSDEPRQPSPGVILTPDQRVHAGQDELPAGTVTFLLTDIEGSTRLWETVPESMDLALDRHNRL